MSEAATTPNEGPLRARAASAELPPSDTMAAGSVIEFMVMPAGTHTCRFGQGDTGVRRTVQVEPGAASALNEQLKAVNASRGNKQRAYFDFDHQDTGPASGWPVDFFWKDGDKAGVYCHAELSQAGAEAIKGRDYRNFSPVFYVTRENPAHVYCRQDAELCMGSLVNQPAFRDIEPLWAREAREPISAAGAAVTTETQTKGQTSMADNATAVAANNTQTTDNTEALKARDTKIVSLESENAALKAMDAKRRKKDAETAVATAVKRGAIPAQDEPLKARWTGLIEENPDNIVLLAALPDNPALSTDSITRGHDGRGTDRLQAMEGPKRTLQAFAKLAGQNKAIEARDAVSYQQKGEISKEMGALYAREISPNLKDYLDMPLRAADYTDPAGNLGTLSGTLVAQRTLELFKLSFPIISNILTDFSDSPAQFGQTEATRIIVQPSVQSYNTAADATGRPQGWSTISAGKTTDVPITLDEHIGVPIVFDSNTLASTMRRLFDEQAGAASYVLAKYFVEKIYKLFTLANYNGYAAKNGVYVPNAYASYAVALGDFARSSLTKIAAIFNPNQVPIPNRVVLLTSAYFEQLATDPSLVTFFSGQQAPGIVTENQLPRLAGFQPIEAPNLTAPGVTPNLVGMALHKAAVIAKTRLSNDYTQALPGSSYGSVTTVTNPDIGISVALVQYVNHTGGYAEWRIQVMLGAAVGDKRGGLCIVSA